MRVAYTVVADQRQWLAFADHVVLASSGSPVHLASFVVAGPGTG